MKKNQTRFQPSLGRECRLVHAIFLLFLQTIVVTGMPQCVMAGGGPENVVVVINADSAASKLIGNYYVYGREIPGRNVVYLNGIPNRERISLDEFRKLILLPIFREMQERKLAKSIDYIVYSADFPTIVDIGKHVQKLFEQLEQKVERKNVERRIFNSQASINALTYYAAAVIRDQPGYMLLNSNSYYRHPAQEILRRPFVGDQQVRFLEAVGKFGDEEPKRLEAIKTLEAMAKQNPLQIAVSYWLARFYGKQGDAKSASQWLRTAVASGWSYRRQTQSDLSFEQVKEDPLFEAVVNRIPDRPFEFVETQGFKHVYNWGLNGCLNNTNGQGNQFFLSTVLAVTRNEGTTEKQALRQMLVSMKADATFPEGTFYFSKTGDVRSTTRQPNFQFAINELERMGHNTEVIKSVLPEQKRDVIGLTTGAPNFNWTASGSKILPGAICDNLTSFGGRMNATSQTKLSEFLKNDAAGASGTVTEPYAIQAKFPHPMIHVHYARGCSLAESFYQSIQGPFQLLIVGDALCQPWGNKPELKIVGVEPFQEIEGKVNLKLDVRNSPAKVGGVELYVDGVMVHRGLYRDTIQFDTAGISDGYHELRVVAISSDRIQSTGHAILPIQVVNEGHKVELSVDRNEYLETDDISLKVDSNYGDSIELVHNMRSIGKKIGRKAEFKVAARLLGRGPVKLEAVSLSESGAAVASIPVELKIEGRIKVRKRLTEGFQDAGR